MSDGSVLPLISLASQVVGLASCQVAFEEVCHFFGCLHAQPLCEQWNDQLAGFPWLPGLNGYLEGEMTCCR